MQRLFLLRPGIVSAAGNGTGQFWSSLTNGDTGGIVRVKTHSQKEFLAGRVDDSLLKKTGARFDMRIIQIEDLALAQISGQIDWAIQKYGRGRIAVCVGSCDNGSQFSLAGHRKYFEQGAFEKEYSIEMQAAQYPATFIKEKYGLTGPAYVFATACSSSGSAVIKAAELIQSGIVDAAIVGGADVASDTALLGFDALESIAEERTNPFSKNRAGITLGEGAAFFVMSRDAVISTGSMTEEAIRKSQGDEQAQGDADVAIQLLGYGESSDANHITAPLADGTGAASAMKAALQCAGLNPGDIDYINLHGTGTHLNDAMEAHGLALAFGSQAEKIPCSSTKPVTGHTLGASSAIELAAAWLSIQNNSEKSAGQARLPLHVYDGQYDTGIPQLNLVQKHSIIERNINVCMSNSFGFGGCNVSLIIGKRNG